MLPTRKSGTHAYASDPQLFTSPLDQFTDVQPSLFGQVSSTETSSGHAVSGSDGRVIPFTSLTSPASLQSIRARAAELERPAPVQNGKVEVSPRQGRTEQSRNGVTRTRTSNSSRSHSNQQRLDFLGNPEVLSQPQSDIICDAPVAPVSLRAQAAFIDILLIALGWLAAASVFLAAKRIVLETGPMNSMLSFDKHDVPVLLGMAVLVGLFYHLLWTFAGRDSIGTQSAGLQLVDFDGNPPTTGRRYVRLFGSVISCAAAGIGIVWAFVDQDGLTWHDHMSSTFPTFGSSRE